MKTAQEKFWDGDFGAKYTERNTPTDVTSWSQKYVQLYGVSRYEMFKYFLDELDKNIKILEVGCNIGMQLAGLQQMGFKNLYGIELQNYAVQEAHKIHKNINIIQGSAFDIPFKDDYFDLVMTNGVLIHIHPDDLSSVMKEIYRCSQKYIMGFEYFADVVTDIKYRGNQDFLWKANYMDIYKTHFPNLVIEKEKQYPYITEQEQGNMDNMFLLEKK